MADCSHKKAVCGRCNSGICSACCKCPKRLGRPTNGHKFKDGSSNFINPRTPFLKTLSTVQNSLSSMHVVPILHFHSCLHGWKIIYITICVLKIHQFVNVQNV